MRIRTRLIRCLVVATMFTGLLLGLGGPAYAADQVALQSSEMKINPDGMLEVTSTLTFSGAAPQQLEQRFRTTEALVGERDYVFGVDGLRATVAGRDVGRVSEDGDHIVLTVDTAGAQQVVISYRVTGAAVRTPSGETLVGWDVLQGLSAGVDEVVGEVVIPGRFTDFKCVAGPPGTQSACDVAEGMPHASPNPRFADGPRGPGEIVGPRITFPASVVAPNERIEERWTVGRAFTGTGWPLAAALATLVAGAVVLFFLHRRAGRDARPSGDPIAVAQFRAVGSGESEFQVSGEVLPGEVGTVIDERVDPIDVTATIVDLAVRGHLLITERPRRSEFALTDWTLRRADGGGQQLRPYEQTLLDAVAPADGREVLASEFGPTISDAIPRVQSHLYDEVVAQGFFERRPDSTRSSWNSAAMLVLVLGVVLTGVLAAFTRFGLTGLAVVAVGLGLAFVAQEMPARTEKGARLLAGLEQLRAQLQSHPTDEMPKGREYHELSEVLPYAIVLGGADRWLAALVKADDDETPDSTDLPWYHGPDNWHLRDLPDSLQNFITTVNGQLFSR